METNPYSTPDSDVFENSPAAGAGEIADTVVEQLKGTKGWVKFMGVMCYIGAVLMLLGGIGFMVFGVIGGTGEEDSLNGISGALMGIIYIVMGLFYFYPGKKLWSYGKNIELLLSDRSTDSLVAALNEQRAFWKFAGIVVIVMLVIYLVAIIGFVVFAGIAAATIGSGGSGA